MKSPVLTLCLILSLAAPAAANEGADGGMGGGMGMGGGGAVAGLSSRVTKRVVRLLQRDFGLCQRLRPVHRFDCYRVTYKLAIDQIAGLPAYRPARGALEGVEDTLERIMARDADPSQPPARKGLRSYRAIAPAAVPQAKRQLSEALDEAETRLLRASADGGTDFARIAQAVNSNKVLLRSAVLRTLRRLRALFA